MEKVIEIGGSFDYKSLIQRMQSIGRFNRDDIKRKEKLEKRKETIKKILEHDSGRYGE